MPCLILQKSIGHLILTSDISNMCFNHTLNLKNIFKTSTERLSDAQILVDIIGHGKKTVAT
jgi:hypothetical protein